MRPFEKPADTTTDFAVRQLRTYFLPFVPLAARLPQLPYRNSLFVEEKKSREIGEKHLEILTRTFPGEKTQAIVATFFSKRRIRGGLRESRRNETKGTRTLTHKLLDNVRQRWRRFLHSSKGRTRETRLDNSTRLIGGKRNGVHAKTERASLSRRSK